MSRPFVLAALAVALLAALAHAPQAGDAWVYDDHRFAEQNTAIRSIQVFEFFRDPATASASEGIQHDIYRPLRTLLFAVEWAVFGDTPAAWHVFSVLLHVLASVLVLRLLWPLVRGVWFAAAVPAAVFAVHPVGVECVAWISSQGDVLAVALMLLSLIAMERAGVGRTIVGLALAALACFAKESAVVLPALLLLRDLGLKDEKALPMRTTLVRTGLVALVVGGYLVVRLTVVPDMAQVSEFIGGSRAASAAGMLAGLVWYAGRLVLPTGFPFDVHLPLPVSFADPAVVLGVGLLLSLLAAGVWGVRRRDGLLALATLGALACLVPVSNVLVPLKALVAERFLYPVLVCVAAGLAWGLSKLSGVWRTVGASVAILAVIALLPVTWQRTSGWKDDLTLWETVLRERPSHMRAYEGLGFVYQQQGRARAAEIAYRSYLEYNPADGKVMRLLGDVFGQVADGLEVVRPEPGVVLEGLAARRRETRMAQLQMYAAALSTWNRIGLVRGRGSPAMLVDTWEKVILAAWDIGDLPKVKEANDVLLTFEGIDPGDVSAVMTGASFARRRLRLDLALKAVTAGVPRDLPRRLHDLRVAQRATLLRDVGITPLIADTEVLARLLPHYRSLAEEPLADLYVQLKIVAILDAMGNPAAADRLLEELRDRFPDAPELAGPRGSR